MIKIIKNSLLALNYGVAVSICLLTLISHQPTIMDKALIGFSAIGVGMVIRKIINSIFPK